DCAAACIATICKQYGSKIPISRIRELALSDLRGTSAYGIVKALEELDFTAKVVTGETASLFERFPLPCIAHIVTNENMLHFVVIHRITKKQIIVADPGKGIVKYTPNDFLKIWTGVLILMLPTQKFIRKDLTKGLFSRYLYLLSPHKNLLLNIFAASIVYTALGILAAFYFKFMMDDIIPNNLETTLHTLSIGIILLYVARILLNAFRVHMLQYLSQKLDIPLIQGYYRHVLSLPLGFFGNYKVGEIVSRYADASNIREAISSTTLTIMIDTVMVVAGAIILYMQSSFLFGITVFMLLIYAVVVYLFNSPIRNVNRQEMEDNTRLTSYLVESVNGIETLKAFNAERNASMQMEKKFVKLLRSIFKGGNIYNAQSSIADSVTQIGGIVVLWAGAYSIIEGRMTIGELLTFKALLVYFVEPIQNLVNLQPLIQTAIVASDRLGEIIDLESEKSKMKSGKIAPKTLFGDIEFKNVDFRYGSWRLVLKNVSMSIKKGKRTALVGASGSGKTTLLKLLMNFYSWEKGDIFINGINIRDIDLENLRERIAYVSQEVFLFSDTVWKNITLGVDHSDPEEVIELAKTTQAHEFINTLPLRYETMIDENGANFSGGQKQILAITRALLKKPDILILDEATANLDPATEKAIKSSLAKLAQNMTVIVIAHRLSTIIWCDDIYVMDKGEFVESGSHEELMKMEGRYYNLWRDQFVETPGNIGKEHVNLSADILSKSGTDELVALKDGSRG
ncbi:MAG: peptidase domain-containing ABC transporter, partial [Peptococcaceae bacterium]|nr:peptidase domain-containing ABC transporter [Peptococcaceae bacterium]